MMAQPSPRPHPSGIVQSPSRAALVAVIDDDDSVRESLPDLLWQVGHRVRAFESAEAFLAADALDQASCLILDVALPGMSGPDLQRELRRRGSTVPIIYITGQTDPTLRPRLLAEGAVACLLKPFSEQALLEALERALGTPS